MSFVFFVAAPANELLNERPWLAKSLNNLTKFMRELRAARGMMREIVSPVGFMRTAHVLRESIAQENPAG